MKTLLPFLKLYRRHILRLLFGMLLAVVTLLASIGLITLSGWFLAATSLAGVAGIYSFNYMLPAAGVRGAAISRTVARYLERLVSHDGTFRVLQHLRVFTFSKLLPLSPAGIARFRQGELLNRLVADVDTLDHLYLRVISPLVGALVVIVVVTFGLSFLDTYLALTLGGLMLLTLVALPPLFYRAGLPVGADLTRLRGEYRSGLTRWLQGQAELSLYGAAQRFRDAMDATEQAWLSAQQRQASLTGLSQGLVMLMGGIAVTLMLWLSAAGIGGDPYPGAYIALFVFCALSAFEALGPVGTAFQHLGHVIASAQRVTQIIEQRPAVTFRQATTQASGQAALTLSNISFGYADNAPLAIRDLSLDITPGEHIALLGRTGCGKSTLLQLLTRAWDPQHGTIQLNGQPLDQYSEADLRARTSVVTQRVHLFSSTLRDNLLLAAPDASDEQLSAALQQVGLEKLLENNQGLNAWLGEGGRQLSGGELRRLGLARALLHGGDLMLLDEPTEGLDAETEQQILALLRQVAQNKTLIMVTHRLRGLAHFDRICVMDSGEIIEQGNHAELVAKQGRYWTFLQRFAL
ncbi:amino acid ABC transporter permease [bacteria symbiont BFo1 of Frankliniella occidentalis]|jgi:ATP-binding cassette subfamily C protein CydC|uniref:heme ABC transporter ATP-binding protein/permease CydC n=1 Tax=Erwinia TaxID=551 RepID=UPI0006644E6D|nr:MULTISPECIES: cysteine/glutathione ABC transporter ATP-binding protein/permease CydC [Erwinia]KMV69876.1 amino acid ABC transporter permease [bacteria symbiont BFo1 of Frankliniella occidentalis]PIJ58473.1 thiol reductant ABC exporter subunit CydC [Erwinia sp. OLMDLW33]KYP84227.1 amino acid ABC transporter permease [bacteria symbiont BFo1 of Frankliniella occidentalis]KYP89082.1 amino acid ABC transporter permease [bacteria symbiont BFo1 of Frankliniella occidentalis]MBD1374099.1 cysteine/g